MDRRHFLSSAAAGAAAANLLQSGRAQDPAANTAPSAKVGATANTKFAVNIEMWFRDRPFLDRIRATADLGFPAVEFWPWKGKDIDGAAKLCDELSIEIAQFTAWGFRPGLNEIANHDAFVQSIEAGCEVAKKLRCRKMTVVGGNDVKGLSPQEMHENITAGLRRAAPIAEAADVMLILEPMNIRVDHKGHCLWGSPEAVKICRDVGSTHVKINWDLYHMQISEGDLCGRMRDGFDQIGYLQLADHPGRTEPGTGEIHYNRVLQEAQKLGYTDFVGLECNPRDGEQKAAERVATADVF